MRGRVLNSVFPTTPTTKPHHATKPTTPTTKLTTSQPNQPHQTTKLPTNYTACNQTNQPNIKLPPSQPKHTPRQLPNYQPTNQLPNHIMQLTNQPPIPKYFSGPQNWLTFPTYLIDIIIVDINLANLSHQYYHYITIRCVPP